MEIQQIDENRPEIHTILKERGWKYFLLALIDVEANFVKKTNFLKSF